MGIRQSHDAGAGAGLRLDLALPCHHSETLAHRDQSDLVAVGHSVDVEADTIVGHPQLDLAVAASHQNRHFGTAGVPDGVRRCLAEDAKQGECDRFRNRCRRTVASEMNVHPVARGHIAAHAARRRLETKQVQLSVHRIGNRENFTRETGQLVGDFLHRSSDFGTRRSGAQSMQPQREPHHALADIFMERPCNRRVMLLVGVHEASAEA